MKQQSNHIYETIKANPDLQTVDVGWATFKIVFKKGLKSGSQNCWGTCDFDTYEIHLEEKIDDSPARETLFHEICHGYLELCGMGGEGEGEDEEYVYASNERVTITVSRAIMMFARLNQELAKELLCLKQILMRSLTTQIWANMDVELSRHASHYSYYSAMQDLGKRKLDDANLDLTIYMSQIRKERKDDSAMQGKPTAKDLDDHVLCQEGYRRLAFKVNELTLKYNMLRSLVQSLGQKKDLLVQLSANMRAEKNIYS